MMKNRFLMFIAALSLAVAMFAMTGCNKKSDPISDNKTTPPTVTEFLYSAKTMTLSVGSYASVQLWAAKRPYKIQKFTDSTVLYTDANTYLANASDGSTENATLYTRGKKVGTSTIVVQDGAGTATILIEVKVQTMGASPDAVTLEIGGSSQYVALSGGTTPYTIKTQPNLSIATVTLSSNYFYANPGSNTGSTFVTIKENGGDSIQVPITVVGRITFKPSSITLFAGNSATDTISGGTAPYAVYNYDATKLSAATISGSIITVSASGSAPTGNTFVSISDNSMPKLMKEVSIYITSPDLSVNTDTIRVVAGQTNSSAYVYNGTSPYSIQTAPTSSVATATMSGQYVSVTGVGAGTTSVVVKDATTPTPKTKAIPIIVTAVGSTTFTTSGSLSFSSNVTSFSATGIYNVSTLTGSGAGGFLTTSNDLLVYGYKYNSSTSVDITMVQFTDTSHIAAGTYVYPGTKSVTISYVPGMNPSTTTITSMYFSTSATATISTFNTTTAQGTFSGTGIFVANSVPDFTRTISVVNGSFNVPLVFGVSPANPADKKIESIVRKIVNSRR
jgi:hypothetical protein